MPEKVGALAARHIQKLQSEFPSTAASWSQEGKFHLTLKFFGNLTAARVADVSRAASIATADTAAFQIMVAGAGAFPSHGPPRVLWLGIEDRDGRLSQLQHRFEAECVRIGFEPELRPFNPHLTLARVRRPQGAKALALAHKHLGFEGIEISVSELLVMRSELNPKGARYSQISCHPLATNS
jgi:2'-5' RNA ligase